MKRLKIVFDTNVLISTFVFKGFSAKVFEYCAIYHSIISSNWILNELTEKLTEKFKIKSSEVDTIKQILNERVDIVRPKTELPKICRDKDDNNILQLSEYTKANYIISGDKDLLILKDFKKTIILSPRTFYEKYISS